MEVARTKVRMPAARTDRLRRPLLEQRMVDALGAHRLLLVCAPAGYGKTTALMAMAADAATRGPLAWLSCDDDDDAGRFLEGLLAALDPLDLPWRVAPEALPALLLQAPGRAAVLGHLVNAMAGVDGAPATLVIDDLHRVADGAVLSLLDGLLERLPEPWSVAIGTRAEPLLALPRLRARGDLVEFGVADLMLTAAESEAIAAAQGADADTALALHERTRGWPAGLQLAMTVLRAAKRRDIDALAPTIDRRIFDFLVAEVVDQLSPPLREFLVTTSPLPRLNSGRAAALSGDARAAEHLEAIERLGLAETTFTGPGRELQLHELVRSALEQRLERLDPDRHREILRRAAATEPDVLRRVAWLLRAEDWAAAEAALEAAADESAAVGGASSVLALAARFPESWRAGSSRLALLTARLRWDWDRTADAALWVASDCAQKGDAEGRRQALSHRAAALAGAYRTAEARALIDELRADAGLPVEALARTLRAQAWLEFAEGRGTAIAPVWRALLDTLERSRSLALWTSCAPLPVYRGLPGMRELLQRYVAGARLRWPEEASVLRASVLLIEAWLEAGAGRVEAAEALAVQAAEENRWLARPPGLDAPTRTLAALLAALRGDALTATTTMRALIEDVGESAPRFRTEVYLGLYEHLAMRWAWLAGDAATARAMALRQLVSPGSGRGLHEGARRHAAAALLATLDGQAEAAVAHWQALLDAPDSGDVYGLLAEARLRLADTLLQVQRQPAVAARVLEPLWDTLALEDSGSLLFAGPTVLHRLAVAPWGAALAPDRVAMLAAASAQAAALRSRGTSNPPTSLRTSAPIAPSLAPGPATPPLTDRELQVLEHIAAGDSNKLIARALDLSPHTVKRHVANILDKLALRSRGQAAAWWQAQRSGDAQPRA